MTLNRAGKSVSVAAAALAALLAGACSPGDVQLNGKIFDAVGATGVLGKPVGSVKLAERQGIIVPPALDKLPPPGTETAATAPLAEIKDPERMKRVNAAELQRQQAAYCKEHYEFAKQRGDAQADQAEGPAGPCRPSAFTAFEAWNKSGDQDTAAEPETTASIPPAPNATVTAAPATSVQVGTITPVPAGKAR